MVQQVYSQLCYSGGLRFKFGWSEEAPHSFDTLKRLLVHSPALALFNPDFPTTVSTDASDYGLEAVLSQIQPNNTEHVVAGG